MAQSTYGFRRRGKKRPSRYIIESEAEPSSSAARKTRRLQAGSSSPAAPGLATAPLPTPNLQQCDKIESVATNPRASGSGSGSSDNSSNNKQDGAFVVRVFRFLNKAFAGEVHGKDLPAEATTPASSRVRGETTIGVDTCSLTHTKGVAETSTPAKRSLKKKGKRGRGRGGRFGGDAVKCRCHRKRCRICGNCEQRHCICEGGPVEARTLKKQERMGRKRSPRRGTASAAARGPNPTICVPVMSCAHEHGIGDSSEEEGEGEAGLAASDNIYTGVGAGGACWNSSGTAFVVYDVARFCRLAQKEGIFQGKFKSFVRQLHFYGFKRRPFDRKKDLDDISQDLIGQPGGGALTFNGDSYISAATAALRSIAAGSSSEWTFEHPKFQRGRPDLAATIRRRNCAEGVLEERKATVLSLTQEVKQVREEAAALRAQLAQMKEAIRLAGFDVLNAMGADL